MKVNTEEYRNWLPSERSLQISHPNRSGRDYDPGQKLSGLRWPFGKLNKTVSTSRPNSKTAVVYASKPKVSCTGNGRDVQITVAYQKEPLVVTRFFFNA